jgi:hypothetical protein
MINDHDTTFRSAVYTAYQRACRMYSVIPSVQVEPDPDPEPPTPERYLSGEPLPQGVYWYRAQWIYAAVYAHKQKIYFPRMEPTEATIAKAARQAAAARACRDTGGSVEALRAAGMGVAE